MMKRITLILLIFLAGSILTGTTYIKPGNVYGYWTQEGSPYYVQGNIYVPQDKYLKIEADTRIVFDGYYQLKVFGVLRALGEKGKMIVFQSNGKPAGWSGIVFKPAPDMNLKSILSYCRLIHFPDYSEPAVPGEIELKAPPPDPYLNYGAAVEKGVLKTF
jgi:hypothetical protein